MNKLIQFFRRLFGAAQEKVREATALTPKEVVRMDDEAFQEAIDTFRSRIHCGLKKMGPISSIPRVSCPVTFPGCAFVENTDRGIVINRKLTLVELDDDMDYTSLCILFEGDPVLILIERSGQLRLKGIGDASEFGVRGLDISTIENVRALDKVLQDVLNDVFKFVSDHVRSQVPPQSPKQRLHSYR